MKHSATAQVTIVFIAVTMLAIKLAATVGGVLYFIKALGY